MAMIKFNEAKFLLKEADILLFRGNGMFSSLIKRADVGLYSHVGLASLWTSEHRSHWECVEFKENYGGRSINLERYIQSHPGLIDVYRAAPVLHKPKYFEQEKNVKSERFALDERCITDIMRSLTGLPYGWRRIWWLAQRKLPILRLFYDVGKTTDDSLHDLIYPVCSTAVAYCYSKCGYDLVKNRADEHTEPSEISRSALLSYLFTLEP